jgi:NADH-quinone oxidoreductase subunit L
MAVTWLTVLTIGLPWLGALCVWMARDQRPRAQHTLAVGFSLAAGLAALALLPKATNEVVLRLPMGGFFGTLTFVPDGLGTFLAAVATVIGSLTVIFSIDYMRGEAQLGRYYALVLFFIGAMAGLALSGSLLFLFLFWEITAFCSYALISFHNDDPKAVAGGIKALIITGLGGIGLLAGALVAYSYLGSYQISVFLAQASTLPRAVLGATAFGCLAAAAAKSAQVPFHTWLPDAMEAPTPVSALIHAATMVNAGVYVLARFYPAFAPVPGWTTAVVTVGLLSALLAGLMAMVANDLKRGLAYSTISQLGYMVYAVGAGGLFASQFHLLSHAVYKALLFLGAGAVIHTLGTRDMRQMGGLGRRMPFVRDAFVVGALALAGVPPLSGFWSKELVLESGLEQGPLWAYLGMLAAAGITALYALRFVWMVFYGEPRHHDVHDAPTAMRVSLGVLALSTLLIWLLAGPFGHALASTLPFHFLTVSSTWDLVQNILTAPATLVALVVVGLGFSAWWWRERLAWLKNRLGRLAGVAAEDFGFEMLNQWIINAVQSSATALRLTQTGQLNWNVVGIVGGLLIVLLFVVWSV